MVLNPRKCFRKKTGLNLTLGLVLIGLRTTAPRIIYTGLKAKPLLNRRRGWGNFIRCLEEMVIWRLILKINRGSHLKNFVYQVVHVALAWNQAL